MEFQLMDVILILLVFGSRILDVSIGTIRLIFVSKGFKYLAPILGFFEVLIWIVVVSKLMGDNQSMLLYVAYAGGFAAGNYVGMKLEEKISVGKVMIQIIAQKDSDKMIKELNEEDYPLTITEAQGKKGQVKIIFSIVDKKKLKKILKIVNNINPKTFYSIEDVRYANSMKALPATRKGLFKIPKKFK